MSQMKSTFLRNEGQWLDEFNQLSVDWIDKKLILLILDSFDMSQRRFNRFIGNTQDWLSKMNKNLYRIKYRYIREAADFLGIPPWLLFYRSYKGEETEQYNKLIIEMFENTPPSLPVFDISFPEKYVYKLKGTSIDNNVKRDNKLLKNLGSSNYSQESIIRGKWKEIQRFFLKRQEKSPYSGAALIYSEDPNKYIYLGTLRIKIEKYNPLDNADVREYGSDPIYWKSCWFSIDVSHEDYEFHKKYENFIVNDISRFLGISPYIFSVTKPNNIITKLYSWHSMRTRNFENEYNLVCTIEDKLKDSKNPLELSVAVDPKNEIINTMSILEEMYLSIINVIKLDTGKLSYTRRPNTLFLLLKNEYIDHGSWLKLHYNIKKEYHYPEEIFLARIVIENGIPKLFWEYDKKVYFITNLTEKIFKEFNVEPISKRKNGNYYWGRLEDNVPLIDLVKSFE